MHSSKSEYTFWELINEYNIQIPIIQRDYAQGRKVDSINEIREGFLSSLHDYIVMDKKLDLDFVYGTIDEDYNFIPLDGQQRLTTLFLLHYYLAIKDGKLNEVSNHLGKFTYETRSTSRDFCYELVNSSDTFKGIDLNQKSNISSIIKNSYWFYLSWEKDPTINAMLTMLDAIHEKFKDSSNLFLRLTKEGLISFKFISLDKFGLEDSLYIKMNARGKALTPFENFKAKLEQYIRINEERRVFKEGYCNEFSIKMDSDWTDLFWNYREKETNVFDDQIMNFIRAVIINEYAVKRRDEEGLEIVSKMINYDNHISFNKFMEFGVIDEWVIRKIEDVLDVLKDGEKRIKQYLSSTEVINEENLFKTIINQGTTGNISFTERVQFYAITEYLVKNKNRIDTNEFTDWIRVVRNLTENTIDNNVKEFSSSISSIYSLMPYCTQILSHLEKGYPIDRFWSEQVKEERLKAKLILRDNRWKEAIEKAENHGYFKGQIGFLLSFSKLDKNNECAWTPIEEDTLLVAFNDYYGKASKIFNRTGLAVDGNLWRRALLTEGDYLLKKSRNLSFLIDSERDISWKRLLRDKKDETDNIDKRAFVKGLVDKIDFNNIEASLVTIINNSNVIDWRRYFIKYGKLIEDCGSNKFIRKESEEKILLLKTSKTFGFNMEYYSRALYYELNDEKHIAYHEDKGVDSVKYVEVVGKECKISFVNTETKSCFNIIDDNSSLQVEKLDEVVIYLKKKSYVV